MHNKKPLRITPTLIHLTDSNITLFSCQSATKTNSTAHKWRHKLNRCQPLETLRLFQTKVSDKQTVAGMRRTEALAWVKIKFWILVQALELSCKRLWIKKWKNVSSGYGPAHVARLIWIAGSEFASTLIIVVAFLFNKIMQWIPVSASLKRQKINDRKVQSCRQFHSRHMIVSRAKLG